MKAKALVLTGYGINCDYETQKAFEMAGALAERVHLNDIIDGRRKMGDYHILAFPGGFSFGDDIGSGKVLANKFRFNLSEQLQDFIREGKLVLGICNGFQSLVKLGILPGFEGNYSSQETTLTFNDSGRFEVRWVYLRANPESPCVFTHGVDKIYLPVRHGEGKFVPKDREVLRRLHDNQQVVFEYVDKNGGLADYPWNPNGSVANIAGICDETGRIFGMMPHPEAHLYPTNHPRWTREGLRKEGMGLALFRNAVEFVGREF